MIINITSSSCKRSDLLRTAQASELEKLIMNDEIESGKGRNQIRILHRPGETRWSSHLNSLQSLIRMYNATLSVLKIVINGPGTYIQHAESDKADTCWHPIVCIYIASYERGHGDYR